MLVKIFKQLLGRQKAKQNIVETTAASLAKAYAHRAEGNLHKAITEFRAVLKDEPYNVEVLNNIGVCLADIGNTSEASHYFETAYSLDDSYVPAIVNHANLLIDSNLSGEALPFLRQAKVYSPNFGQTDQVFAGMRFKMGDLAVSRHFQLNAWLANFDSLRSANCHLFAGIYNDIDETLMAAEHRFWAETVRPFEIPENIAALASEASLLTAMRSDLSLPKKIRIGYWSPDLYGHSVRYFFRPLLEGHDTERFEVFLYHDFLKVDEQTAAMRAACAHYHDVYALPDAEFFALVRSHQLDILVELAGHSSYNRLPMLQQRFATVQISGIGYPPTTGLSTIDAKVLDRYVHTPDSARYYAESPMVLPSSFWCFDPLENAPVAPNPPVDHNGYVTFACVGNLSKISDCMLRCWKEILERIPTARFLIRSVTFRDPATEVFLRQRLLAMHMPLERIDLRQPEEGGAFFESYNEIDIILDTFPFNGGTTTCFSTYMGVPVVSLTGASLVSRMGLSILSNLGVPDLAVNTTDEYIARAVVLANDVAFLQKFRLEARSKFKQSSLGNGKLFAKEFEEACENLLTQKQNGSFNYQPSIDLLPANEILRRAYAVLRHGQPDAAQRILVHCLRHYPDNGGAHLLVAQQWISERRFDEAADYLLTRLEKFDPIEKIAAFISVARLYLLLGSTTRAQKVVESLVAMRPDDLFDRLQVQLYGACCKSLLTVDHESPNQQGNVRRIHVMIPCDDHERFDEVCMQIRDACSCPSGWIVSYGRCDERRRIAAYKEAMSHMGDGILVIVQKNIEIHNSAFLIEVALALEKCDVLGIAGATRWQRLDWRVDQFTNKAAGFIVASAEQPGMVEIQCLGTKPGRVTDGIAVLDGSVLAIRCDRVLDVAFDEELAATELLLEEDWTHSAFLSGCSLSVHRNLGVLAHQSTTFDVISRSAGRLRIAEKQGFDVFVMDKEDIMMVSAPAPTAADAVRICDIFLHDTMEFHRSDEPPEL